MVLINKGPTGLSIVKQNRDRLTVLLEIQTTCIVHFEVNKQNHVPVIALKWSLCFFGTSNGPFYNETVQLKHGYNFIEWNDRRTKGPRNRNFRHTDGDFNRKAMKFCHSHIYNNNINKLSFLWSININLRRYFFSPSYRFTYWNAVCLYKFR